MMGPERLGSVHTDEGAQLNDFQLRDAVLGRFIMGHLSLPVIVHIVRSLSLCSCQRTSLVNKSVLVILWFNATPKP